MRPARIAIEIDELVLHGFAPLDRHAVASAMQAELVHLIREHGLREAPAADVEVAVHDAGLLPLAYGRREQRLGTGLARATFRATTDAAEGE